MLTRKIGDFRHARKNKVNFKNKSISVFTRKPSQFLPPQNQVKFDPDAEVESISIPTLKISQFCMPPDTNTKLISIQTLNRVISDPCTKQVNSDPYTEIKSTSTPNTEITSSSTTHITTKSSPMPTLKPCHFRAVLHCVLSLPVHVLTIQQQEYV